MLVSTSSSIFQSRPCSSGLVRLEMSTGTDWPRLEDPLVDVVFHLVETGSFPCPSFAGRLGTFLLLPVFPFLELALSIGVLHGLPTLQPSRYPNHSCMQPHSQSCSGQITICLCRSAGLAWKIWQSLLGAGICGKSFGTAKIALSFWIMSFTSLKDIDASRSQSLETFGAMHGVRLIIAPHITVLAQSANALRWMRLALVAQLNTN